MENAWQVVLWVSTGLLVYSYALYPLIMKYFGQLCKEYDEINELLEIDIVIAAYNEESIIESKIRSTFNTTYPLNKINVFVGSDCSTDRTNEILKRLQSEFKNLHCTFFTTRTGKPGIVNQLVKQTNATLLLFTDADTLFEKTTLIELVKPFQDHKVGGVQANFITISAATSQGFEQEKSYNSMELETKKGESYFGAMIGAHGACNAIRKSLYSPVPLGFIVDDFYIFAKVLEQGYKTVFASKSMCSLVISGDPKVEFKRKRRIGKGNFQNFFHFKFLWFPFKNVVSLLYWSHKVIRWFGPFLMLFTFWSNVFLYNSSTLYTITLTLQLLLYLIVVVSAFAHISVPRALYFAVHFVKMNVAVLIGFYDYLVANKLSFWNNE